MKFALGESFQLYISFEREKKLKETVQSSEIESYASRSLRRLHVEFPAVIEDPDEQRIWMELSFSTLFNTEHSNHGWKGTLDGIEIVNGSSVSNVAGRGKTELACVTSAYNRVVNAVKAGAYLRAHHEPGRITVDMNDMQIHFID